MSKTILNLPIRRDWQGVGNPYWTMFIFSLNKKTRKKNVKRTVFVYMSSVSVLFLVFLALLGLEHALVQYLNIDGVRHGTKLRQNCIFFALHCINISIFQSETQHLTEKWSNFIASYSFHPETCLKLLLDTGLHLKPIIYRLVRCIFVLLSP